MTPKQRKAMEQALEALEWWCNDLLQGRNAADALRAALTEHYCDTHCTWLDHAAGCDKAEQPAESLDGKLVMGLAVIRELTGTQKTDNIEATIEAVRKAVALQPAKRVPLTDDDIEQAAARGDGTHSGLAHAVIAAYDAKNGITGETK